MREINTKTNVDYSFYSSYDINFSHFKDIVVVCSGCLSFSTIFQSYQSGCDRELSVHFCSAASLKYHVPDT